MKTKPISSQSLLLLLTAIGLAFVYLCFYTMVLLPRHLDRACASHTDELCMAAMDSEGTGYNGK